LSSAQTVKFVDEQELNRGDILKSIFGALEQTHYADAENIGAGPYKSMVSFVDDHGDGQQKSLQMWTVSSSIISDPSDGQPVNQVLAWIPQTMGDSQTPVVIRAVVKIKKAPTKNADGSYADAGVWTLNAKFVDDASQFFAAEATVDSSGRAVIKMHQAMQDGPAGTLHEEKAYMVQSPTSGFGKLLFTDYSGCHSQGCSGVPAFGEYAYDPDALASKIGSQPPTFRNRNNAVDVVDKYGVFIAGSGANVVNTKKFGFSLRYKDQGGNEQYAYYGAWQGRSNIWTNGGQALPGGLAVTRGDQPPDHADSYTTSDPFVGTRGKRTLVDSSIAAIAGVPLQVWLSTNFEITYVALQHGYTKCLNPDYSHFPRVCSSSGPMTPADFASLVMDPNDQSRSVGINGYDQQTHVSVSYLYDPSGPFGAGFYVASMQSGRPVSTGVKLNPADGQQLNANINGPIWLMINANGSVVQKTVASLDPNTHQPTFDDTADRPFALDPNRQYYFSNQGANTVVTASAGGSILSVQTELQSVPNPTNTTTFVAADATFTTPWDLSGSTFSFNTSPGPKFMKLVYKTVGQQDAATGAHVGDVVNKGFWGLVLQGSQSTDSFNWDYPQQGGCTSCGTTQYLLDANHQYVILDNPIRFRPFTVTDGSGATLTVAAQFDGNWMQGLRNVFGDLQQNDWTMTPAIANKVANIPSHTILTDADDGTITYEVIQLRVREFLRPLADPGNLSLSTADALDLNNLGAATSFVDSSPPIGTLPDGPLKYSDGVKI